MKLTKEVTMTNPLSFEQLTKAFHDIGITSGTELEVHSSLSSFGYVKGGAETVISALKEVCGSDGSIFMPALRLSPELPLTEEDKKFGITVKIKVLPENCERSAMGIIADTFRRQPDTVTGKGVFRISGWGKNAQKAIDGGLTHVIQNGGMALLLGVDIYKLTAMHYVEDILPKKISDIFAPDDEVNAIYPPDQWFIETGAPPVKPWYTIQDMAYQKGLIKDGYIGSCKYMYFNIRDVVSLYQQELKNDPYRLYGVEDMK